MGKPSYLDKIRLVGISGKTHLGVPAEEKLVAQEVSLDVTLYVKIGTVIYTDDIKDTVNYADVLKTIQKELTVQHNTVESLAGMLAGRIQGEHPRVEAVTVLLRKPKALAHKGVDCVEVEITRP